MRRRVAALGTRSEWEVTADPAPARQLTFQAPGRSGSWMTSGCSVAQEPQGLLHEQGVVLEDAAVPGIGVDAQFGVGE